jgi:hypothetical protein
MPVITPVTRNAIRARARRRAVAAACPIVAVNLVAIMGQYGYIRTHVHWPLPGDVLFAVALESIALYLAYMAHETLIAGDSAFRLRVASYLFAALVGAMNYSHYTTGWRPSFEGTATGLMSVSSPWLWGIYSRRRNRDRLQARGLIEPCSVRLGFTRWFWWPAQSLRVFRLAAWTGERNPARAIESAVLRERTTNSAEEHANVRTLTTGQSRQ